MEQRALMEFELNRAANLIRAHGLTVNTSSFQEEKVSFTAEKTMMGVGNDLKKLESDRLGVMFKSLGWVLVQSEFPLNSLMVHFEKVIKGEVK